MAAHQAPLSLGFSRQEHLSGLPFPSPMCESEKWKWSSIRLFTTPWTAAYQASPSMGFSRQEYWSGLPLPKNVHFKWVSMWFWCCCPTTRDHTLRITAIDIHVGKCAHPLIEKSVPLPVRVTSITLSWLLHQPTIICIFFFSNWRSLPFPSWSSARTHISVSLAKNWK